MNNITDRSVASAKSSNANVERVSKLWVNRRTGAVLDPGDFTPDEPWQIAAQLQKELARESTTDGNKSDGGQHVRFAENRTGSA